MVHADASHFPEGTTKPQAYEQVLSQAAALFDGKRNWVCNLANTASLLWHAYQSLPPPSRSVNWAGFYTATPTPAASPSPSPPAGLILGPFMGKVACQTIALGRGVVGAAAAARQTVRVADVDAFPGHIACDAASRSEIVVPVFSQLGGGEAEGKGELVAVIDVDCGEVDGFDAVDQLYLERLAELLSKSCDW